MKDVTESTQGDDWTRERLYSIDDVSTAGALQWYRWPDGTERRYEYKGVGVLVPVCKVVDGSTTGDGVTIPYPTHNRCPVCGSSPTRVYGGIMHCANCGAWGSRVNDGNDTGE